MKQIISFFISLLISMSVILPVSATGTGATEPGGNVYDALNSTVDNTTQYKDQIKENEGEAKIYTLIGRVINIVLGFLGLIALILVIWSGIQWMTSGGNEDKTKEAKDRMKAGVIGLIIILGAAVLTNFILDMILKATA
ncbi:MAG TPA: pilin [Patescibacteria group bacterium]|nr:pilin [Patescibacteria group bacterium]